MKLEDFVKLVDLIIKQKSFDDAWNVYYRGVGDLSGYLVTSWGVIKSRLPEGFTISDRCFKLFLEAARERLKKVWDPNMMFDRAVKYPPEMKYLYPLAFASRYPLVPWSTVPSDDLARKVKQRCSIMFKAVNVAFRLGRYIMLVELDTSNIDLALAMADIARELQLPHCLSWHGGLHIFIPLVHNYKKGAKLVLKFEERDQYGKIEREVQAYHTVPIKFKVMGGLGVVEIRLDGIVVHPLQGALWDEIDKLRNADVRQELASRGQTVIDSFTLLERKINLKHAVTVNWFVHGLPCEHIKDPENVLKWLFKRIEEKLEGTPITASKVEKQKGKIVIEGEKQVELVEIRLEECEKSIEEEARTGLISDPFREYYPTARVKPYGSAHLPIGRFIYPISYGVTDIAVFNVVEGEQILKILEYMYGQGILPHCIKYMLFEKPPVEAEKFGLNIVGFYLLSQLFPIFMNEEEFMSESGREKWRARLRPLARKLVENEGLKGVRWYYFEKFSGLYRMPSNVLLREKLDGLVQTPVCLNCPYRHICSNVRKPAGTRLQLVANEIAKIAVKDRFLIEYVNDEVARRVLLGKPLPVALVKAERPARKKTIRN